jgi:uncharacterized protein
MKYKIASLEEEFHNPFDNAEKEKSKKPVRMTDSGGPLKQRKETFNINRVLYSKRPNGEYTLMSKTQFAQNEIIEICPIIMVGIEAKAIPMLKDYVFEIEKEGFGSTGKGMYGIVLGYGSLYRHSDTPNVSYAYNRSNKQMYFMAAKTIQAQEELTIDYGKDYWAERTAFNTLAPKNETPASTEEIKEGSEMADKFVGSGSVSPAFMANTGIPPQSGGM